MPTRLTIEVPRDYELARDACSYGYFLLAPSYWDTRRCAYVRVLDLESGPARLTITQPAPDLDGRAPLTRAPTLAELRRHRGRPVRAAADRILTRHEQAQARRQITRMLRLDEDESRIADFHRADPRWKRSGRGRVMRSPTLFEDVIKTVTSCNVTWPSTVTMNRRLCEVCGRGGAFPTPRKLARTRPATLRGRCRVGYRDSRIVELARLFARGELDPDWFEDPATPSDRIHDRLLALPGIGPYAAANIMQLLGRYEHLPLDTESLRHGRTILGYDGTDRHVMAAVRAHFAPFGAHAFRSYWFEMWDFYEKKAGPSWTWEQETTATAFTASNF